LNRRNEKKKGRPFKKINVLPSEDLSLNKTYVGSVTPNGLLMPKNTIIAEHSQCTADSTKIELFESNKHVVTHKKKDWNLHVSLVKNTKVPLIKSRCVAGVKRTAESEPNSASVGEMPVGNKVMRVSPTSRGKLKNKQSAFGDEISRSWSMTSMLPETTVPNNLKQNFKRDNSNLLEAAASKSARQILDSSNSVSQEQSETVDNEHYLVDNNPSSTSKPLSQLVRRPPSNSMGHSKSHNIKRFRNTRSAINLTNQTIKALCTSIETGLLECKKKLPSVVNGKVNRLGFKNHSIRTKREMGTGAMKKKLSAQHQHKLLRCRPSIKRLVDCKSEGIPGPNVEVLSNTVTDIRQHLKQHVKSNKDLQSPKKVKSSANVIENNRSKIISKVDLDEEDQDDVKYELNVKSKRVKRSLTAVEVHIPDECKVVMDLLTVTDDKNVSPSGDTKRRRKNSRPVAIKEKTLVAGGSVDGDINLSTAKRNGNKCDRLWLY